MANETVTEQELIIGQLLELAVTPEQVMFLKDIAPEVSISRRRDMEDARLRLEESRVAYKDAIRTIANVLKNSY